MPSVSTFSKKDISFYYSITENPAATAFNFHCHEWFEVYYFISGEGYYLIEGRRYELKPFSLLVIRPGEVHCFRETGNSTYERYIINFSPDFIDEPADDRALLLSTFLDRELGANNLYRTGNESSIRWIFDELTYACSLPERELHLSAKYLLGMLLTKILLMSESEEYRRTENYSSELVTGVIRCINDHLTEHLTLDSIAERFYISKYHLSRIFKSLTGVSVIEYLIRKRVFLSQRLLKEGSTAAEACAKTGFGDYSTFYRDFKRIVGHSPQKVRNSGEE